MAKIKLRKYEDGGWLASAMTMTPDGWRQLHWKVEVDEGQDENAPEKAGAAVQGLFEKKARVQNGTSERGDMQ